MAASSLYAMAFPVAGPAPSGTARLIMGVRFVERMTEFAMHLRCVTSIRSSKAGFRFLGLTGQPTTSSAEPRPSFGDPRVLGSVLVAVVAMCAGRIVRGVVRASEEIYPHGHGLKVSRVYAERVATKVVQGESGGNGSMFALPSPPPSANGFTMTEEATVDAAVARLDRAGPNPAWAGVRHVLRDGTKSINLGENLSVGKGGACHPSFVTERED